MPDHVAQVTLSPYGRQHIIQSRHDEFVPKLLSETITLMAKLD